VLAAEHVDGRAACDEVEHHLCRHRLRIGAHARMGNAMVCCEHHRGRPHQRGRFGVLDQADLHGQLFQPAERAERLGLAVHGSAQALTQRGVKGRKFNLHSGTAFRVRHPAAPGCLGKMHA
jgi:hypothetical protein